MNPEASDQVDRINNSKALEAVANVLANRRPVEPGNSYLKAKGLSASTTGHIYAGDEIAGVPCKGSLIVAISNAAMMSVNAVAMVETVPGEFAELFVPGAPIAGNWARIGKKSETIYVATNYASGLSIHEATGHGVAVVFFDRNLAPVCKSLHGLYPDANLVVCAGFWRPKDKSEAKSLALEAASQVGARVVFPKGARTFNELHRTQGVDAVRECLESAECPSTDWIAHGNSSPIAWPNPIHPAGLMEHATEHIARYVVLARLAIIAVVLWTLATYFVRHMRVAPMLALLSAIKGCGKTSLVGVLTKLVHRPEALANITLAALFRVIEAENPTLMMDEAERWIGKSEELTALINAGHTRQTAYVKRVGKNGEIQTFRTFGFKLIAQRGEDPDETIVDRSVVIRMERKRRDEITLKYDETKDDELVAIRAQIERFAADNDDAIKQARPSLPDLGNDRAEDNWEPLFAVASCGGSAWLTAASEAAISLTSNETGPRSTLEELLTDLQALFRSKGKTRLTTSEILGGLVADDERPWLTFSRNRPITTHDFSRILRQVKVKSRSIRTPDAILRGYYVSDFEDAFSRYVPPVST